MQSHFTKLTCRNAVLLCGALLTAAPCLVHAQEAMKRLTGNLSPLVAQAVPIGRAGAAERVRFAIALPVRNQAQLDAFLQQLYTPGDPNFHHFLKTGEFAERFGPTQADYDAVIEYAKKQGFNVVGTHSNRLLLEVAAPVSTVEKAFAVQMRHHQAASGRVFHAPDNEPALPAAIAARVSGIIGLDDAQEPLNNLLAAPRRKPLLGGTSQSGTGPNSDLTPSDIKSAYNLNGVTETGTGQTIALFELDGYTASDITAYEDKFSLRHVPLTNVLLDGFNGTPTVPTVKNPFPGSAEVTLDIEMAVALAPNAAGITVYEGTSFVNVYNRIASDNTAQQVSTSWYAGQEGDVAASTRNSENTAFQQMATQGQSFYAASGDFGSNVKTGTDKNGNAILKFGVQDPSSQQWACGVGGTVVTTDKAGGVWQSETGWSGSGGGISTIWPLPNYQSAVVSSGSGGSATARNVPDVSLDSASGYAVYYNGSWKTLNGTSAAAPLWAAFNALVNQRRVNNGSGRFGFPNPTLYFLAQSPNYASDFHDISTGNNGTYAAVTGYDNVTGLGTFNGANLIGDLQTNADVLYVDGSFNGTQLGTVANPYKTVGLAIFAASSFRPTLIYIKGNAYLENMTITKNVLLVNNGGGYVAIGN